MRFYIPGTEIAGDDPVEAFREKVMSRASVVTTSGDAIAIFREISCLSPRGRYDIKIFPTYIHLHGKTFDYKIPSTHVQRLFLLPHKDQRQMHFAVNLDPPLKQGQTRYHFLVFNFKMEDEEDIELPFTDEEVQEKFEGKLEREMSGPTHDLLSKIIKAVVNKKVTRPDTFKSHAGHQSVTCNHKAAAGFIYLLERGLIFIYKPPIFLRYVIITICTYFFYTNVSFLYRIEKYNIFCDVLGMMKFGVSPLNVVEELTEVLILK